MTDFNVNATNQIDTEYHRDNSHISNDKDWQRHSDGWIQIQEQSKKLKSLRKIPELKNASIGEIRQLIDGKSLSLE